MNGKIVDEPIDIANNFNNFFVNVGPETEKTVQVSGLLNVCQIVPAYKMRKLLQKKRDSMWTYSHTSNLVFLTHR